jgi:chromosome segregation ATPase
MDIEKAMQFILDMQAKLQAKHEAAVQKHDAALQKHDEEIAEVRGLITENARAIQANTARTAQLVDVSLSLASHAEETGRQIREVDDRLGQRLEKLAESQSHTDRRLDAAIDMPSKLSVIVEKLAKRNASRQ